MNVILKQWQMIILILMILISLSVSLLLIVDYSKPLHYSLLFILPLVFTFLLIIFAKLFRVFLNNIGVTMIMGLLFCRLVISPFLMFLGGYPDIVTLNINQYTSFAILLVMYETIAVMFAMFVLMDRESDEDHNFESNCVCLINKRYRLMVFSILLVQLAIFVYTPELLEGYRTMFQISDQYFTSLEQYHIIHKYGTTFWKKFSLVTGSYLMNIIRLVLPCYLIVCINRKKRSKIRQLVSYLTALIPLFLIDGTIARSVIYSFILFFIIRYIYPFKNTKKMAKIFVIASIGVILFWIIRFNASSNQTDILRYFAIRFSTYFSGVNIVAGSFNLPRNIKTRIHYFAYDYLKSIPFGNTLFSLEAGDIQKFFNNVNGTSGQIPTTIGSGYYYFGFLLAPVYSIIFAIMAFKMGKQVNKSKNIISKMRYLFLTVTFSMGIVMYNIPITLSRLFSVALPLYLIEVYAFGIQRRNNKSSLICVSAESSE